MVGAGHPTRLIFMLTVFVFITLLGCLIFTRLWRRKEMIFAFLFRNGLSDIGYRGHKVLPAITVAHLGAVEYKKGIHPIVKYVSKGLGIRNLSKSQDKEVKRMLLLSNQAYFVPGGVRLMRQIVSWLVLLLFAGVSVGLTFGALFLRDALKNGTIGNLSPSDRDLFARVSSSLVLSFIVPILDSTYYKLETEARTE